MGCAIAPIASSVRGTKWSTEGAERVPSQPASRKPCRVIWYSRQSGKSVFSHYWGTPVTTDENWHRIWILHVKIHYIDIKFFCKTFILDAFNLFTVTVISQHSELSILMFRKVPPRLCPYMIGPTRLGPHDWAQTRLCPDTIVPRHDCAQTRLCPDTTVPRHDCAQTRLYQDTFNLCPDIIVPRHYCAQTLLCPDTSVPRHISAPTRIIMVRYDHVLGQ